MFNQDPDRNVGFLLHDVSRLIRKRFDRRARAFGLTRAQWRVLVHLAPRQGINQSSLADILELDSVTLGRHIDRLQKTGWLERRADPVDRRAWCLFLTEKARPVLQRMEALAVRTQSEAMEGLSGAQLDRLMATLLSIKRNVLALEAARLPDPDEAGAVDAEDGNAEDGDTGPAPRPARRAAAK